MKWRNLVGSYGGVHHAFGLYFKRWSLWEYLRSSSEKALRKIALAKLKMVIVFLLSSSRICTCMCICVKVETNCEWDSSQNAEGTMTLHHIQQAMSVTLPYTWRGTPHGSLKLREYMWLLPQKRHTWWPGWERRMASQTSSIVDHC